MQIMNPQSFDVGSDSDQSHQICQSDNLTLYLKYLKKEKQEMVVYSA